MKINLKSMAELLLIVCACVSLVNAQQPTTRDLPVRVIQYHGDMAMLLANLAAQYEVTIGLEADLEKPKPEVTLDLRDVRLPEILNGIVQSEPRYQWRENDGCIEVFPVNGGLSLLDTPIRSFQVKDVHRDLAINRLLGVPEVRALALSMNLKPRPPYPPSERIRDEKLSFDLNGVTLREACFPESSR